MKLSLIEQTISIKKRNLEINLLKLFQEIIKGNIFIDDVALGPN